MFLLLLLPNTALKIKQSNGLIWRFAWKRSSKLNTEIELTLLVKIETGEVLKGEPGSHAVVMLLPAPFDPLRLPCLLLRQPLNLSASRAFFSATRFSLAAASASATSSSENRGS